MKNYKKKNTICVLGLGYVGLPLCIELVEHYIVYGYDLNKKRLNELKNNYDRNNDLNSREINKLKKINYINNLSKIDNCSTYIVTVPTPITKNKNPDFKFINKACVEIGKKIKKNDIIIFESTFYPGMTEEHCVPLIEKYSNLKYKKDFFCGYSPERINPGDKKNKITNIVKITSGSDSKTLKKVDDIYTKIIKAGTYKVKSIIIAEAAKVIENTQRDLNIAFINELSIILDKMNVDTQDVLSAASTKWNFLNFKPGLVGGHCIGVDPYYLTYKAKKLNLNTNVILSGRKINDDMPKYIVKKLLNELQNHYTTHINKKVLILGYTFKENCSDYRNSKVENIVSQLVKNKIQISIYDPHIKIKTIKNNQKKYFTEKPRENFFDAILLTVKHDQFKKMGIKKILSYSKNKILFDLKALFPKNYSKFRL